MENKKYNIFAYIGIGTFLLIGIIIAIGYIQGDGTIIGEQINSTYFVSAQNYSIIVGLGGGGGSSGGSSGGSGGGAGDSGTGGSGYQGNAGANSVSGVGGGGGGAGTAGTSYNSLASGGRGENETYYYKWKEYDSHEEALYYAKEFKKGKKEMGINIKYFIMETQDSWFLPIPKYVVFLNKRLEE